MADRLADWLNDRTGYRALVRLFADEILPGPARWRYVFGSGLASVFLIQAFTGLLMMTAYATPKLAVEAIKAGANDYLPKPFGPEELLQKVKSAGERYHLLQQNASLRARAGGQRA